MIEFKGYLIGNALKYYCNIMVKYMQKLILFSLIPALVLLMVAFYLIFKVNVLYPEIIISEIILVIIAIMIPKLLMKIKKNTFIRIYIEYDAIVCESGSSTESRFIENIKEVIDYSEYYVLIFSNYRIPFICQKDLLTQGSLEEFENLFAGKIKKM